MNSDLISVVVPCYNVAKYLEKCVQSIINQTYQNLEIILVNDGATDSTPEICDKLAQTDSRIKVIHKTNEGVSVARNTGIENATGKYIVFFDSDDWVEPDTIKTAVEKIYNNNLDLVVWGYVADFVDEFETVLNSRECKVSGICEKGNADVLIQKNALGLSGYVWNKVYLLDIIRKNNISFKTHISLYEDLLFNSQYYLHCKKIGFIDHIGNHYIQRGCATLGTKRYENVLELKLMGCSAREHILNHFNIDEKEISKIMGVFYYSALKSAIYNIKTEPDISKKEKIKKIKEFVSDKNVKDIIRKSRKLPIKQKILVIAAQLRLSNILLKM